VTPIPSLEFLSESEQSNVLNLTWMTASGLYYNVQYKTNLLQPHWENLGIPILATGYPLTFSDTNAVSSSTPRFYRLVAAP
jgi:hypothetical protein